MNRYKRMDKRQEEKSSICSLPGKKNNKIKSTKHGKGFTLVELIVVLVVIAILAGVAVPLMLGFVDNSREKKYITEAKAALSASESMLSDAYTDGRNSLNAAVRNQAFLTSGLGDNTEFTIWTQNTMKQADGTYKTIGCYTVDHALYKTEDGVYVAYDSQYKVHNRDEWSIVNDGFEFITDQTENNGNIIRVWRYTGIDTASGSDYIDDTQNGVQDAEDDNDDYADNNKGDIGQEYDQPYSEGGGENDDLKATLNVTFVGFVDEAGTSGGTKTNVVGVDFSNSSKTEINGVPAFSSAYNEEGFAESPEFKVSKLFNDTTLTWSSDADVPSGTIKNMNDIQAYLDGMLSYENDGRSITLTASVSEAYCKVPVSFIPFEEKTQVVNVDNAKAYNMINASDNQKETVKYSVGLVSGTIDKSDSDYFDVTSSGVVKVNPTTATAGIARHDDGNWVPGLYEGTEVSYLDSSYNETTSNYDVKQLGDVENWVSEWVVAQIPYESAGNDNTINSKITAIEASDVVFAAPADVQKTVFLKAKETGEVEFKKDNTTEDPIAGYNVSFSKNEISSDIYVLDSSGNKSVNPIGNNYSILGNAGLSLVIKDSKKLKLWDIYDCSKDGNVAANATPDDRTRDVDDVLDRLYTANENFGELAEIDADLLTTLLANTGDNSSETPLRALFTRLVSDNDIEIIEYIGFGERGQYGYYSPNMEEVCISTTTLKGSPFVAENGDTEVDNMDYDYPAYTIAFTTGDNHIYVFTEDDTTMKAKDSLKGLHSGFSGMTKNTFLGALDTADVNNLESMLDGCESLRSGATADVLELDNFYSTGIISSANMFKNCTALSSLSLSGFTSSEGLGTTQSMFEGCSNLESLAIDSFNTDHVENMSSMFKGCNKLAKLGTSTDDENVYVLHVDKAENIQYIFSGCSELQKSVISGGSEGNVCPLAVAGMTDMFAGCNSLKDVTVKDSVFLTLDVLQYIYKSDKNALENAYLNTTKINGGTSLSALFEGCTKLKKAEFDEDSTKHVTNMSSMFKGCTSLGTASTENNSGEASTTQKLIIGLNTENAADLSMMFYGCTGLTNANTLPVANADASESTYLEVDTSHATNMSQMFYGCTNITTAGVRIDKVTDLSKLFENCSRLSSVVLRGGGMNVEASLTNGSTYTDIFKSAGTISTDPDKNPGIDITLEKAYFPNFLFKKKTINNLKDNEKWSSDSNGSTSGLYKLFDSARTNAQSITLNELSFSDMYSMDYVFGRRGSSDFGVNKTAGFTKLETVEFNNVSAPGLGRLKGLFMNDPELKTVTFNNFKTEQAWNFSFMFNNCLKLNTVNMEGYDVSGDDAEYFTDYSAMFKDCRELVTINGLTSFETHNCKDMKFMFANCFKIGGATHTLDLSSFDTSNVRTDYIEKNNKKSSNIASGFDRMFGTINTDNNNNNAADISDGLHQSELEKIIVTDGLFVVNDQINTDKNTMFGSGLVNLNKDGETHIDTPKVSKKDHKHKYFAWIDGKPRENSGDTQGYFTGKAAPKYAKLQLMGNNWPLKNSTNFYLVSDKNNIVGFMRNTEITDPEEAERLGGTSRSVLPSESDFSYENNTDIHGNSYSQYLSKDNEAYPVYFWTTPAAESGKYIINWWSEADVVYMNSESWSTFNGWKNLASADLTGIDFSEMQYFSYMFYECQALEELNGFSLKGAKAKNRKGSVNVNSEVESGLIDMFKNCKKLTSIDLRGLDASQINSMYMTFLGCSQLKTINLSGINALNLQSMGATFNGCENLTNVDLSGFNTPSLTSMYCTFINCKSLETLDISSFDFTNVTNMEKTFNSCQSLTTIYSSASTDASIAAASISSDRNLFNDCGSLEGGQGTKVIKTDAGYRRAYAHIDGGDSNPGYFTDVSQKPSGD